MPRLTVMMPAMNARDTISAALGSTLRAMPPDSELIVFDDGSTDDTAAQAERVRDSRLRIIRSDENVGGGEARQRIMSASDSELVASMDADDISFPWRFRAQFPQLRGADVSFGGTIHFQTEPFRVRPSSPLAYSPHDSALALLVHNPFAHPTLLARRKSITDAGGYSNLRRAQDYELWLRMARNGARITRTPIPVLGYRRSSSQVSKDAEYSTSVRRDPTLWATYLDHTRSFFSVPNSYAIAPPESLPVQERQRIYRDLRQAITTMSRLNRGRYQRYLRENRATLLQ